MSIFGNRPARRVLLAVRSGASLGTLGVTGGAICALADPRSRLSVIAAHALAAGVLAGLLGIGLRSVSARRRALAAVLGTVLVGALTGIAVANEDNERRERAPLEVDAKIARGSAGVAVAAAAARSLR